MALPDAVIGLFIGLVVVAYVTDGVPTPNFGNNILSTKEFPSLKITNGKEKHEWNYKQTWYNALKSYTELGKLLYGHFKKVLKDDKTSHRVLESTTKHIDNNWLGKDQTETEVIASLKDQTASGSIVKNKQDIVLGKENKGDLSQNEMVNTAGKTNIKPKITDLNLNKTVDKNKKSMSKSGEAVIEAKMNEAVNNSVRRQSDTEDAYRSPKGKENDTVTVNLNANQGDATLSGSKNNQDVIANTYVDTVETETSFKERSQQVTSKNDAITSPQHSGKQNVKIDSTTLVEKKQGNVDGNLKAATNANGHGSMLSSVVSNGSYSNVISDRLAPASQLGNGTSFKETTIQPSMTSMKTINLQPSVKTPFDSGSYTLPSKVDNISKSPNAPSTVDKMKTNQHELSILNNENLLARTKLMISSPEEIFNSDMTIPSGTLKKTDSVPTGARIATTIDTYTLYKDQTAEQLTGFVSKATVLSTPQRLSPLKHNKQNTNQAPDGPSGLLPSKLDVVSTYVAPGIWISSARNAKTLENLPSLDPNVSVFSKSEVVLYPHNISVNDSGHRAEEITYHAQAIIENTFTNSQLGSQNPKEDTTKSDKFGMANHKTNSNSKVITNSRSNSHWDTTGDKRDAYIDPVLIINDKLDPLENQTTSVHQSNQIEATSSTDNQAGKTVNNDNGTYLSKHPETVNTTTKSIGNTTESNMLNGTKTSNLSKTAGRLQSNEITPIERSTVETNKSSENMTYRTDVNITTNSTTPSEDVQEKPPSQPIQKGHKSSEDSLKDGYGNRRNSNKFNDNSSSEET